MPLNRRNFLKTTAISGLATAVPFTFSSSCKDSAKDLTTIYKKLDEAAARPVLLTLTLNQYYYS